MVLPVSFTVFHFELQCTYDVYGIYVLTGCLSLVTNNEAFLGSDGLFWRLSECLTNERSRKAIVWLNA